MSKEKEQETIEVILGSQYGSDVEHLAKGQVDPRRFTNITEAEIFACAWLRQVPDKEGGAYAKDFVEDFLNLKMSLGGWRANQGIKVIAGSKGAPTIDVRKRPGWMSRNVTERRWKEKAEQEGAEIIE